MKLLIFLSLNFICLLCLGQKGEQKESAVFYGGIGAGLDYGGIGFKAEWLPVKYISIFAGAGANFDNVGYNGGFSFKILPAKKSTPFVMAMYGYNAVLKTKAPASGITTFVKTYYGFSAGAGYDIRVGKKFNKISLAIIIPFRNNEFTDKYNEFKDQGYLFKPEKSDVLGSIGFNIGISATSK